MKIARILKSQPRFVPLDLIGFDTKAIDISDEEEIVFIHDPLNIIRVGKVSEGFRCYYISTIQRYITGFNTLEEALLEAMKMMIDAIFKYDL